MIFITVGSQKFPFDRLLKMIDALIEKKIIVDSEVIGQIGYATYQPKCFSARKFYPKAEMLALIEQADIIITHGGTASIITALEKKKKVIVCPREHTYGEHVDNHQLEIAKLFQERNYCFEAKNQEMLSECLKKINNHSFQTFQPNRKIFFNKLLNLIDSECD